MQRSNLQERQNNVGKTSVLFHCLTGLTLDPPQEPPLPSQGKGCFKYEWKHQLRKLRGSRKRFVSRVTISKVTICVSQTRDRYVKFLSV